MKTDWRGYILWIVQFYHNHINVHRYIESNWVSCFWLLLSLHVCVCVHTNMYIKSGACTLADRLTDINLLLIGTPCKSIIVSASVVVVVVFFSIQTFISLWIFIRILWCSFVLVFFGLIFALSWNYLTAFKSISIGRIMCWVNGFYSPQGFLFAYFSLILALAMTLTKIYWFLLILSPIYNVMIYHFVLCSIIE